MPSSFLQEPEETQQQAGNCGSSGQIRPSTAAIVKAPGINTSITDGFCWSKTSVCSLDSYTTHSRHHLLTHPTHQPRTHTSRTTCLHTPLIYSHIRRIYSHISVLCSHRHSSTQTSNLLTHLTYPSTDSRSSSYTQPLIYSHTQLSC